MKAIYGILLVGVSALALGGCTSDEKAAFANALLGSGAINTEDGTVDSVSDAGTDAKTTATITPGDDDTVTVAVSGGGQVAGPREYEQDLTNDVGDTPNSGYLTDDSAFWVGKPTDGEAPGSILVAAWDENAVAGFVGANAASGSGNVAAGYGVLVAPVSANMPTGTVSYQGDAAATAQREGDTPAFISGNAYVDANFTDGSVTGGFEFNHTVPNAMAGTPDPQFTDDLYGPLADDNLLFVGFTGAMSTDKATYASSAVAFNGIPATGNVIGGFAGANYETTAGAFDVQSNSNQSWGDNTNPVKITGSFIASQAN